MHIIIKHRILLLISFTNLLLSCKGQEIEIPNTTPVLYLQGRDRYNLKGQVKELRAFIYKHFDKKDLKSEENFLFESGIIQERLTDYQRFFKWGGNHASVGSLDSINEPLPHIYRGMVSSLQFHKDNRTNFLKKNKWAIGMPNPFTVRTPLAVKIDENYFKSQKDTTNINLYYSILYKYRRDDLGKIIEERMYQTSPNRNENKVNPGDLEHRITYNYNIKGQVIRKDIHMRESLKGTDRFLEQMMYEYIIFSIREKLHYEYEYDTKDRLKKMALFRNNSVVYSEEYTYNDQNKPTMVYYYTPDRSSSYKLTAHTQTILDEHGNTVEEIGLDKEGKVVGKRFYEYQYDDYGNWIHASVYLDGKKDTPIKTAKRIISYYKEETTQSDHKEITN